jgi:cardiolipin synthase
MRVIDFLLHPSTVTIALHLIIVVAISVRVIMRRVATGVALAWLFLVATLPLAGALIYLLIGERRINRGRARGISRLRTDYNAIYSSSS